MDNVTFFCFLCGAICAALFLVMSYRVHPTRGKVRGSNLGRRDIPGFCGCSCRYWLRVPTAFIEENGLRGFSYVADAFAR